MSDKRKDNKLYLGHVIESCKKISGFIKSHDAKEFFQDGILQDAVMYQLSVIGEALKNTTQEFKDNHEEIPWSKIIGMRNIVLHDYDRVNIQIVWNTIIKDIPELKKQIQQILTSL